MNLDLLVFILEIIYPKYKGCIQMSNELQFSLNKINEIKDYFIAEIKERELMSKILIKYITSFDYFDETLIILSVATGSMLFYYLQLLLEHQ